MTSSAPIAADDPGGGTASPERGGGAASPGRGTGAKSDTPGRGTGAEPDMPGRGTGAEPDTPGRGTGAKSDTPGRGAGAESDTPGSGTAEAQPKVDGRTARAERTRTAIIDAQLRLVRDGDLRPTADRIARAAGVSLRALWSHFADLEALFAESGRRVLAERDAAYVPIPPGLPLTERIDAFCRQRARLLEMLTPTARASALIEPFSATLQHYRRLHVARVRSEVLATFATEVGDDQVLVDALTSISLWPAWWTWRDAMELSIDATVAALNRSVTALLTPLRPAAEQPLSG